MQVTPFLSDSILFSLETLQSLHGMDGELGSLLQILSLICHYLGGTLFFLILISLTYTMFRPKLALELSIGLLTAGIIIALAKFFFESPRPYPYPPDFEEKAFGLPSGHSYVAVVVWGLLAYRIRNIWFRAMSFCIIIFTPFSRMYLGLHFLGDVILGCVLGVIHLMIILFLIRHLDQKKLKHYFFQTDKHRTLSLIGMLLTLSIILLDSNSASSEHFFSLSSAMTSAGALAGFWMGLLFYPKFSKEHFLDWGLPFTNGKIDYLGILIRLAVLTVIIVVFYLLPSQFLKNSIWKEDLFLRYMRYFLISFCLVFLFPVVLQSIAGGKFLLKVKDEEN
ncbi:phosphatase PAP2 family protein [Leptospira ognonensis]|uniref:Phosphatase PAP2 family protein n=1 Tax=Leptospira ognonensis TaxID=2484945 RepID=A0A4R9K475_9LEPT|nr:phosphatase PAP2 family protein [Leptospira ognonensis]TGL60256.1 phosphatase PAP2 family protein [Leptospira ognonensis]